MRKVISCTPNTIWSITIRDLAGGTVAGRKEGDRAGSGVLQDLVWSDLLESLDHYPSRISASSLQKAVIPWCAAATSLSDMIAMFAI